MEIGIGSESEEQMLESEEQMLESELDSAPLEAKTGGGVFGLGGGLNLGGALYVLKWVTFLTCALIIFSSFGGIGSISAFSSLSKLSWSKGHS